MPDNPFYRFFRRFDVPVPFETWEKLPRIGTHKNEYWDGEAHYTPRPKTCEPYLDLTRWSGPPRPEEPDGVNSWLRVGVERLRDEDWPALPGLFHWAFANQQPLSSWGKHAAARASRCVIEWARLGRDGPPVRDACFVARTSESPEPDAPLDRLCGAVIVVLVPENRLRGAPAGAAMPHPEDPAKPVVPHLDWVFIHQWRQRHGIGSLLLNAAARALAARGFRWLASTCLLDNAPSLLWHWRNGFQLPPDPYTRVLKAVPSDAKT